MRCTPGIEVGVVLSNLAYLNCLDFRSEGDWQSKAARRELNHASNIRQSSKLSRIESKTDRFHGTYPPNFNEGTHLISRKGPTQFQVVPFVF
jgi:hypothetical protein